MLLVWCVDFVRGSVAVLVRGAAAFPVVCLTSRVRKCVCLFYQSAKGLYYFFWKHLLKLEVQPPRLYFMIISLFTPSLSLLGNSDSLGLRIFILVFLGIYPLYLLYWNRPVGGALLHSWFQMRPWGGKAQGLTLGNCSATWSESPHTKFLICLLLILAPLRKTLPLLFLVLVIYSISHIV